MTAVRRTQLARLGVWIGLATVAVLTAVLAARTESGIRRIAGLLSPAPQEQPVRTAKGPTPPLVQRQSDQEAEQRRLSEAIRLLAADRDRLLARINTLERSVEDVTGSIAAPTPRVSPPAPLPSIGPSANDQPAVPRAATTAPPAPTANPPPASPAPGATGNRVAAGHLATGNPLASESVATRTEFGVDLGGHTSTEGLKTLWASLKTSQAAMLEGLRPVMAIREGGKPGSVELRLIAGPLANASIATRLCAALGAAGQACQPAVFDGQKLALQ
jgi:hypothetical protein